MSLRTMNSHSPAPLPTWIAIACLCFVLVACQAPPTRLDQHFGHAVKAAQNQPTRQATPQTCAHHTLSQHSARHGDIAPKMACHPSEGSDSDGIAAQSAIEQYQQSFQKPASRPSATHIGSGLGSTLAP